MTKIVADVRIVLRTGVSIVSGKTNTETALNDLFVDENTFLLLDEYGLEIVSAEVRAITETD